IRAALVEADLIDCIVNLPAKLFLNTQIPASLWFMSRKGTPSLDPSQREGSHYRGGFDFSGLVKEARELRSNQTPAEEILWQLVRNKKFLNLKFRRQHQIGPYIVDFYCHSKRLIIELDGAVHDSEERKKIDRKRDKYLSSLGNTVLRFKNNEILDSPQQVLTQISKILSPLGRDGREGESFSPLGRDGREGESFSPLGRDGREGEILFIDARNLGHLINRRTKVLSPEDIEQITSTYHNWRNKFPSSGGVPEGRGGYKDIPGFCASIPKERVAELDYVLTPGRYVGLPEEEDDFDFVERFSSLKAEFEAQLKEEAELNEFIAKNLSKIKVDG